EKLSSIDSQASSRRLLPGLSAHQVPLPERPGPALQRPRLIHRTNPFRMHHPPVGGRSLPIAPRVFHRHFLHEYAIKSAMARIPDFLQRHSPAHFPAIGPDQFLPRYPKDFHQFRDLPPADPHVPRTAATAVAALAARKPQPLRKPRRRRLPRFQNPQLHDVIGVYRLEDQWLMTNDK